MKKENKSKKKATVENFDIWKMDWLAILKEGRDTD